MLVGFTLLGTSVWLLRRSADDPKRSRPVVAEVAGYAGVAFAIGGAGMLLGEFWDELGIAGRIALPLVGSAYAYTCAVLVERAKTGSAHRLSQLLFAIGAITAAAMVAMVARPIIEGGQPAGRMDAGVVESRTAFVGAIAGVIAGGVTWWFRKGVATQLVFIGAIVMTVVTAMGLVSSIEEQIWIPATALSVIGIVWVVLGAMNRLLPSNTAIASGSFVAIMGLQMLQRTSMGEPVMWASWLRSVSLGGCYRGQRDHQAGRAPGLRGLRARDVLDHDDRHVCSRGESARR